MSSETNCNQLELHPLDDSYICSINVDITITEHGSSRWQMLQTVIILDRSGSMGQSVQKITNEILPIVFNKLKYKPDDTIHLITFDTYCEVLTKKVCDFGKLTLTSRGSTNMTSAIRAFQELFGTFNMNGGSVRVLTISDGDVDNPNSTKQAGDDLAKFIAEFHVPINSQAMRLFTSNVSDHKS